MGLYAIQYLFHRHFRLILDWYPCMITQQWGCPQLTAKAARSLIAP